MNAARLRKGLKKYYERPGTKDPLVVSLPLGRYVPVFITAGDQHHGPKPIAATKPEPSGRQFEPSTQRGLRNVLLAAMVVVLSICSAALVYATSAPSRYNGSVVLVRDANIIGRSPEAEGTAKNLEVTLAGYLDRYQIYDVIRATATEFPSILTRTLADADPAQRVYIIDLFVEALGNTIAVQWQLSDARSKRVLWTETIDELPGENGRNLRSVHVLSEIAAALASEDGIIQKLERAWAARKPAPGYECVASSHAFLVDLSDKRRSVLQACLLETVKRFPDRAEAWASLAYLYAEESRMREAKGEHHQAAEALALGWYANEFASRLAPGTLLTERATMMLAFESRKLNLFSEKADIALLRLLPGSRDRLMIGERLFALGDYGRASQIIQTALSNMRKPTPVDRMKLFLVHYQKADYRAAFDALDGIGCPRLYLYWVFKAAAAGQVNDPEAARLGMRELSRLNPNFSTQLERDLGNRNHRPEFISRVMDGLRKAEQIALGFSGADPVRNTCLPYGQIAQM